MKISIEDSCAMITAAGRLQDFARMLDPTRYWNDTTISSWKRKGIAHDIQLDYYEHLQELRYMLINKRGKYEYVKRTQ